MPKIGVGKMVHFILGCDIAGESPDVVAEGTVVHIEGDVATIDAKVRVKIPLSELRSGIAPQEAVKPTLDDEHPELDSLCTLCGEHQNYPTDEKNGMCASCDEEGMVFRKNDGMWPCAKCKAPAMNWADRDKLCNVCSGRPESGAPRLVAVKQYNTPSQIALPLTVIGRARVRRGSEPPKNGS